MAIVLNHTIVPAHDKVASAKFFGEIFGLSYKGNNGHFAPVQVNDALTFDFDNRDSFESHHYAFHVSDQEFDAILACVKKKGIPYGSYPYDQSNGKINNWNGGRGFYFHDPNGHSLELLTKT
jgi:catechol 2,3-dioxygenase-like lactoylglutathione lyase family enzyme